MLKFWSPVIQKGQILACAWLAFIFTFSAWAWPPTYGAEFEFYKPGVTWGETNYNGKEALKTKAEFTELVRQACGGCREMIVRGKFGDHVRFIFPSGFWLTVTHDLGVIEILTKPATLEELRAVQPELDRVLFKAAKAGGFRIDREDTAHFNFGAKSAFGNNPKEFLRFFVDYQNHAHLALGSLGQDLHNAPPLSALTEAQRQALQLVIEQTEAGRFKTISEVADEIRRKVYTQTYDPAFGDPIHYQALGLKYLTYNNLKEGDRPVELRAVWAQPNTGHFIRVAELIEARLAYLKQKQEPIVYKPQSLVEIPTWEESATRFYVYVVETGLDFEKFKMLLPREAREAGLADFLNEDVALDVRIKSLTEYQDLISISSWFRHYAEQLIARAGPHRSSEVTKMLEEIKNAQTRERPASVVRAARCEAIHLGTLPKSSIWSQVLGF
jgi:hypothetical protein